MGVRAPLVLTAVLACALALVVAPSAFGYTWGSTVTPLGPEETVFDWSTMACEPLDLPDSSAVAFRDAAGNVQLIASHYVTRRMIGPSLNDVRHDCRVLMGSEQDPDPSQYSDREWISALYTDDGSTVYALATNEYEGWLHPGMCPAPSTYLECWQNSLTLAVSTDGGNSYAHPPGVSHLVASVPYQYSAGSPAYGIFGPSNIIHRADGYYYMLAKTEAHGLQQEGVCLLRTADLSDATSWRAWDGTDFNTRFIDPYVETTEPPDAHVCQPIATTQIDKMFDNITYNTYFNKYMLVGTDFTVDQTSGAEIWGFYYSLSSDLIHWTGRKLLLQAEVPWTYQCGDEDPVLQPSILDPTSTSRNFDTSGQSPYLYFVHSHIQFIGPNCYRLFDRDLDRFPIQFTGPGAAAAAASFTASSTATPTGSPVTFDASRSKTVDDSHATYRWDLDGNGSFETDTGSNPKATRSYLKPGKVTVRLRVIDEIGDHMQAQRRLTITSCRHHEQRQCVKR